MQGGLDPDRGTILVVDDEDLNRQLIEAQLVPEGYRVLLAASGPVALELIARHRPDLVLLDVLMPGMNGFETCRRIRQDPRSALLPVVFVTALADRDSRVRGIEAGADDFLTKPIDEPMLLARVRNLLQVKAYHDLQARQQERLEEELERTRTQLLHADRLATLGTLAAGVGHELANIASVLQSALYMIHEQVAEGQQPEREDLEALDTCERHLVEHVEQLRRLGRPAAEQPGSVDLVETVEASLAMLRLTGRMRHTQVECSFPDPPILVYIDRTRLEQVLINLVANAADALAHKEHGHGHIRLSASLDVTAGRVLCEVADNGPGLPSGAEQRIFEPYFTTKLPGEGTGLGLVVVKSIVEASGGRVMVESRVGEGTAFTLQLPTAPA